MHCKTKLAFKLETVSDMMLETNEEQKHSWICEVFVHTFFSIARANAWHFYHITCRLMFLLTLTNYWGERYLRQTIGKWEDRYRDRATDVCQVKKSSEDRLGHQSYFKGSLCVCYTQTFHVSCWLVTVK
jgi:hypothetical protein